MTARSSHPTFDGWGGWQTHMRWHRLALPELFELIEVPDLRLHDMDDDITQIDEDPFTDIFTFDAEWHRIVFLRLFGNMAGQRLDVPLGGSAGNHHKIRHAGLATDIHHQNIAPLAIIQRGQHQLQKFIRIHGRSALGGFKHRRQWVIL